MANALLYAGLALVAYTKASIAANRAFGGNRSYRINWPPFTSSVSPVM